MVSCGKSPQLMSKSETPKKIAELLVGLKAGALSPDEKIKKNFQKPIDKHGIMWYN
jgi:hypothetical protein